MSGPAARRVAVVTGAATGIGAAIAEELGRQGAFVVTLDANVSLDGSGPSGTEGPTTAERIVDAGGVARAADMSVTDADSVNELLAGLVAEFGSVDAVVNVAGISRPTSFGDGTAEDWEAVLQVHLERHESDTLVCLMRYLGDSRTCSFRAFNSYDGTRWSTGTRVFFTSGLADFDIAQWTRS